MYCPVRADKVATGTLSQLTMDNGNEELETQATCNANTEAEYTRSPLSSVYLESWLFFIDFLIILQHYRIPVSSIILVGLYLELRMQSLLKLCRISPFKVQNIHFHILIMSKVKNPHFIP